MSVEHTPTSPPCAGSRLLRRAAVFLALGLSGFFSVPELAAQNLTQVHYRWRNDDGGESANIAAVQTVNGSTAGAGSFTLASWTPGANRLVLVAVAVRDETRTVTVSGNSLNFVEIAKVDNIDGENGIHFFRAMGSAPTTGSITVTITGNTLPALAVTNGAWVFGAGTHRNRSLTVPGGETGLSINNSVGTGLNVTSLSSWYESVPAPGTVTIGANGLTEVRQSSVYSGYFAEIGTGPE